MRLEKFVVFGTCHEDINNNNNNNNTNNKIWNRHRVWFSPHDHKIIILEPLCLLGLQEINYSNIINKSSLFEFFFRLCMRHKHATHANNGIIMLHEDHDMHHKTRSMTDILAYHVSNFHKLYCIVKHVKEWKLPFLLEVRLVEIRASHYSQLPEQHSSNKN